MGDEGKDGKKQVTEELGTVAPDPRFSSQNCTNWCWGSFVDYHKCVKLLSEGDATCQYFEKVYTTICPNSWIEKWTEEIKEGTFPYKFDKDDKNKHTEDENDKQSKNEKTAKKC